MYCMFGISNNWNESDKTGEYTMNCREWASLTSPEIPLSDIEDVVYKWDISMIQALIDKKKRHRSTNNSFAKWITRHNDTEVADFLILAKTNEQIRSRQRSAWYYHVDDDNESLSLKEVSSRSMAYKVTRLKDRYVLQAIRALFALRDYDACINVWSENQKSFKEGIIKELAVGYVAGAYERMGNKEEAWHVCIDNNCKLYLPLSVDENFAFRYKRDPDDPALFGLIQTKIHSLELELNKYQEEDKHQYEKLYSKITPIVEERKCKEMAKWYYAMAFVADKLGEPAEALTYVRKAQKCVKDKETSDALRVLKLYIKTKNTPVYDQQFEDYLYHELVWLDKRISDGLTTQVKNDIIKNGIWSYLYGTGIYYWSDMLRKIVIGQVVPLCLKSNYKTRALQYLNMADNNVFKKTGYVSPSFLYPHADACDNTPVSWQTYRSSDNTYNDYDYKNDFFINLDTIGVKYVKRLVYRMNHPLNEMDEFLTRNSYTDNRYLYDIIGTQLIALMRYDEAVEYLSLVPDKFYNSRNVYEYFNRDPFDNGKKKEKLKSRYKLHFAQDMLLMERKIRSEKDPNNKAEYMLRYARGVEQSFGRCWALTSYYQSVSVGRTSLYRKNLINALAEVETVRNKAFGLFTDDERAAKAYADWYKFKTAATKYPDTQTAKYIRGHCDILIDYK